MALDLWNHGSRYGLGARRCATGKSRVAVACALALGFAVATAATAGAMYKYTDEKGNVIYSDQPPPNVKAELIKPPPPPSNPNAVKELINAEAEMKLREKQRVEKASEAEKKRADTIKRQEVCERAQAQLQALQRGDLYRYNAKGERTYVDAETRQRETEEQRKIMRENCPA
jgi:hypothetical protein